MIEVAHPLDRLAEGRRADRVEGPEARLGQLVAVDGGADEERDAGAGEGVIHHRVPHVPLEPALRLGPDLADDISFGVAGPDPHAELAPESVVVDLVGDVETPAVD